MKNSSDFVIFFPHGHEQHHQAGHPERPERVEAFCQGLREIGVWDLASQTSPAQIPTGLLERVHSPTYLDQLEEACRHGASLDADTYTRPASWGLARQAVGGAIAIVHAVWTGESRAGLAITRPPGHHATRERGMGFCLLNNAAVAAEYLISGLSAPVRGAERLAIIDLDLHHGNGIQDIFWRRGDVFYISTHQSPLYPGSGALEEIGAGPGEGATMNLPLPPGTGDAGLMAMLEELILPALNSFRPQMLLVCVGFDPHWKDPLGHLRCSAQGFHFIIDRLAVWAEKNCGGKIALFLEGGYDLEAARACSQAIMTVFFQKPWQDFLGPPPRPEGRSWQEVLKQAKTIWKY